MRARWRGFELPTRVVLDDTTATQTYGLFTAEPFEQGMGTTIGNSLRRILLSAIEGFAPSWLKIKGVPHEFSSIKGVYEDVTNIVLNLKQLVVKLNGESPKTLTLEANKKGKVLASNIQPQAGVEILNPEHLICTLMDDVEFKSEIGVMRGRGYHFAKELVEGEHEIGTIYMDCNFSPVKRVKYRVENTRVGKKTNYDKLTLEIWTNGVVTPEESLVRASKILRKHLHPFVLYYEIGRPLQRDEMKEAEETKKQQETEELRKKLNLSISELDLSIRATNCLRAEHIETVGELVVRTDEDLLKIRNFGKTSLREIQKKLSKIGLQLGMNLEAILGKK